MPTMRAAQVHRYGDPHVIRVQPVSVPEPTAGQVLVRVHATTVNGGEVAMRAGRLRLLSGRRFPKGLGIDFAGEIAALGPKVTDVALGDRVWGVLDAMRNTITQAPLGAAAEYLVVDASRTAPLPPESSFADAVALLTGTTALTALRDKAHLQPGERLLVRGGTGGVGNVGVQLGHAFGAHVTTLVSASNLDTARRLGADVVLDYATTRPAELETFDVILDTVGSDMHAYWNRLSPRGRMVAISFDPPLRGLAMILASAVHGRRRIRTFSGNPSRTLLEDYARYLVDGTLHPLIAGTHALDELDAAHEAVEAGGQAGKHIIMV